jgi:hypothetical protein
MLQRYRPSKFKSHCLRRIKLPLPLQAFCLEVLIQPLGSDGCKFEHKITPSRPSDRPPETPRPTTFVHRLFLDYYPEGADLDDGFQSLPTPYPTSFGFDQRRKVGVRVKKTPKKINQRQRQLHSRSSPQRNSRTVTVHL